MPTFHVIRLSTGQPITDLNGNALVYPNGPAAAQTAANLTSRNAEKYQPRAIANGDWRLREMRRFDDGTYQSLFWVRDRARWWYQDGPHQAHFAHASKEEPGKIAFIANEKDGREDRQTRLRVSKYLTRFFGGSSGIVFPLTDAQIKKVSAQFDEEQGLGFKLRFAKRPQTIRRVYLACEVAGNCMGHEPDFYKALRGTGHHPVDVYQNEQGTLDLQVAYVRRPSDNRIISRAMVWPAKKLYGRVYGDQPRIIHLLEKAGYRFKERMAKGARLRKIHVHAGCFVCPYIDAGQNRDYGQMGVVLEGDYLIVSERGRLASYDMGTVEIPRSAEFEAYVAEQYDEDEDEDEELYTCANCGERCEETFPVWVSQTRSREWCEECADNLAIDCEGPLVIEEQAVAMGHGGYHWPIWRFEASGAICQYSDERWPREDLVEVHTNDGIEKWAYPYADEAAQTCAVTGELWFAEQMINLADDRLVAPTTAEARLERERQSN